MRLAEAVRLANAAQSEDADEFGVALVCGFEPMHLRTFLTAHVRQRLPAYRVDVSTGLFGSAADNLRRALDSQAAARVLVVEWPDLDPRLGIRDLGGWHPDHLVDIVGSAKATLDILRDLCERGGASAPLAMSLPSLPLPPLWYTPSDRCDAFEADLRAAVGSFGADCARMTGVRLASAQQLDLRSPAGQRRDVKGELTYGYPYQIAHTDVLAELLANAIAGPQPKKGLITDADDTLWRGLVGEVGADAVTWDLHSHSHAHGLYQQTLASLAAAGTLIAIASKNDPLPFAEALARPDMLLRGDQVYPLEVHWQPKSASVRRILDTWNVGADSVVFVDDNALELAQVKDAFPDIEVLQFPTHDDAAVFELCRQLRDLFAREALTEEDGLRLGSLRAAAELREMAAADDVTLADDFLAQIGARVTVEWQSAAGDARALELVNKTNQFNLNGRRYTELAWRSELDEPERFLLVVSYDDKFGRLGKIAAMRGRRSGATAHVDTWVMSCRAFSRRIELQCLAVLFDELRVDEIELDFQPTPRNGPVVDVLSAVTGGAPSSPWRVTKDDFMINCPELHHELVVVRSDREAIDDRT